MGFMAGFGSAFADSFQQQQKQSGDLKADKIKMDYESALTRKKEIDKQDKQNAADFDRVKEIARVTQQPDEAIPTLYKLLKNGGSEEQVWRLARENQANIVKPSGDTTSPGDTSGPADPRDDLTSGAQDAVSSQMAASGMKQPAPDTGLFGSTPEAIKGDAPTPTPSPQDTGGAVRRPSVDVGPTATPTVGNNQQPNAATQNNSGKPDGIGQQGEIRKGKDGKNYQYAETTGMSIDDGSGQGWIETTMEPGSNGTPTSQTQGEPATNPDGSQVTWAPRDTTNWSTLRAAANNLNDAIALDEWTKTHPATPQQKAEAAQLRKVFEQEKVDSITRQGLATGQGYRISRAFVKDGKGGYTGETAYPDYSQDDIHPIWRDSKGKEIPVEMVQQVSKDQEADMANVAKEGTEALKPYQQSKQDTKDFIRTAHDYIGLLKDSGGKYDGKAMDISGNVSQFVDRWRRAGINIADVVMPKGNIDDAASAIGELDSAKQRIENQLSSGRLIDDVSKNAMKASLIDIQGTKLAYQMAAQANGSTKGISNADFQHFKDIVSGNGNPQTAAKALQMSINQAVKSVGGMEGDIKQGKGAASYYKNKYNNAPNGFDMGESFDDETKNDPEISQALKDINADASMEDNPGQQVNTDDKTIPDWVKQVPPDKPIIGFTGKPILPGAWKFMDPEIVEAIRKKNGL